MYAIVEVKGKQYKAEKGSVLKVDFMEGEAGTKVDINSVLFMSGDSIKIGSPYVPGAMVRASIRSHEKGDKIIVYKYKSKKNYRKKQGHRQNYTLLSVEDILGL